MNRVLSVFMVLIFCLVSIDLIADTENNNKLENKRKGFEPYNIKGNIISSNDLKYLQIAFWEDKTTNLFWSNGTTTVAKENNVIYRTWKEAVSYCSSLKYGQKTNWRLATKEELEQLSDSGVHRLNNFPGIGNLYSWFWSSSEVVHDNDYVWLVFIKSGVSNYIPKNSESYGVLCVHD